MGKLLFLTLLCLAAVSCSKDESNTPDITKTVYEQGKEYTRKCYFSSHALSYDPVYGVFAICYFGSECGRVSFIINDYEPGAPSSELRSEIINLQANNTSKEFGYYLVADFRFIYGENTPKSVGNWTIVIGQLKEYIFDGNIYQQLIVKE